MNKKVAIIGVGNCGGQVAYLAEKKYGDLFDTVYINSSETDLSMVSADRNVMKFKIGEKEEVEGSGKNREKMKQYLLEDIMNILGNEKFQQCIFEKKYCYIVTSAAGGTGSGSGPVLMELMRQTFPDVNFTIIGVLPQIRASLMEHGNEIEFLKEIYEVLGPNTTYMIYDNESTADLPPTKALEVVNENIVEDLKILTGVENYSTPYESIDEADMESIKTTPGRLLVARVKTGITEKVMEDTAIDDMIIKAIKQSCHAETDRDKKVVRWGIITYFTEEVNRLYSPSLDKLSEFLGTPVERFNHNAINPGSERTNFVYLIASGLGPINDRVKKTTDRIDELKKALVSDDRSNYILSGEGSSYDVIAARKLTDKRANQMSDVSPENIFKKFMK